MLLFIKTLLFKWYMFRNGNGCKICLFLVLWELHGMDLEYLIRVCKVLLLLLYVERRNVTSKRWKGENAALNMLRPSAIVHKNLFKVEIFGDASDAHYCYCKSQPVKIDLNKKSFPKQKTIQNFNIDAQGFRQTKNENSPTWEIRVTS